MTHRMPLLASAFLFLSVAALPPANASDMTIDLTQRNGALKKGGLGTLFGISTIAGGTPSNLISNTIVNITASQGRASDNGSNPYSTDSIAPLIRGKGIRLMCRLNDLLPGFPYRWNGLANWDQQVTTAIQDISDNYPDVVYAVEVLNEPDAQLNNTAFNNDPAVQGSTYNARINWLWTHTVQEIRSITPTLKVMGPNYLSYLPATKGADQQKMQDFLLNAIQTGTSPDIIGWHSLLTPDPADIGRSLNNYRTLEAQLGVPNAPLPVSIDEYGVNDGTFEGVPGSVVKYWAEMERDKIDFGGEGVYTNYSQLGNTLRYPWQTGQSTLEPNGGWYMLNWYNQMAGEYVPVSSASTRYDQAYDGVASWDPNTKTATVLLGGSDDDADIHVNGLGSVGLGNFVRVRVDSTVWTVDPNQGDRTIERGGDPENSTYNIFDGNLPLRGGNIDIPLHRIDRKNGYRILITAAGNADAYPTKYEAESAYLRQANIQTGSRNNLASGNAYVSGMTKPNSSATFNVTVLDTGIYWMYVRYANATGGTAEQKLTVNGEDQGSVIYAATKGGANSEFAFTEKRVVLNAGTNAIRLAKQNGNAALDYIDVRPDTHRYQAVYAFFGNTTPRSFQSEYILPDYVGGLNGYDAYVEFAVDAPRSGTYNLNVAYGNGLGDAVDNLIVNQMPVGAVTLPATGSFLFPGDPRLAEKVVTVPVTLNEGINRVRLQKQTNFAELDYVALTLR